MFNLIWGAVQTILAPATEMIKGWQARKQSKLESDLRVNEARTEAKIRILEKGQQADIAWENLSISNSGWKDEYWTLVLSIPAILCFIPGAAAYVRAGFDALRQCPDWYQWALLVAIASSFGYKKLADFMSLRKGDGIGGALTSVLGVTEKGEDDK